MPKLDFPYNQMNTIVVVIIQPSSCRQKQLSILKHPVEPRYKREKRLHEEKDHDHNEEIHTGD